MSTPSAPAGPAIDLGVRRDLSGLIEGAVGLWRRNVAAFLSLALLVVAPAALVNEYFTTRLLDDFRSVQDQINATPAGQAPDIALPSGMASAVAIVVAISFLQGPLITAIHARAVVALSKAPTIEFGAAIRDAGRVAVIVVIAEVLAALLTAGAMIALIIPGIYVGMRLLFAAQVAAVDGRLKGALGGSWRLVRGQWWRTFGLFLLFSLMAGIANQVVGGLATGLFASIGVPALGLAARVIAQGVTASLVALALTLLFFDLRVRAGEQAASVAPTGWDGPAADG